MIFCLSCKKHTKDDNVIGNLQKIIDHIFQLNAISVKR